MKPKKSLILLVCIITLISLQNTTALGDVTLNLGATYNVTPDAPVTTNNVLAHFGYHTGPNGVLNLNNNDGMMGGGNPLAGPTYYGMSFLTTGPGNRGLDFNNDGDFIATGSVGRNDYYSNLWFGTFTAPQTGLYEFKNNGDDDRGGIWFDINQNGIFESTTTNLSDNKGEQLSWENGTWRGVSLTAGEEYLIAFTHSEGQGGSRADFLLRGPGITGEPRVKPGDAGQAGLFSYTGTPDSALGAVTVEGNSTLNIEATIPSAIADSLAFNNTSSDPSTLNINVAHPKQTFDVSGTTILSGNGAILNLGNSPVVILDDVVSGTGGLTISGDGTVFLNAANTYAGETVVNDGVVLSISDGAALGDTSAGTTVNNGGSLLLTGGGNFGIDEPLTLIGGGNAMSDGALHSQGNNHDINGPVSLGGNATIRKDGGGDMEFRGGIDTNGYELRFENENTTRIYNNGITGSGTLVKEENGILEIRTNSPSYSGQVNINDGVIDVNNQSQGLGTGGINIDGDATLRLRSNVNLANNITLNGTANNGNGNNEGRIRNDDNNNTLSGSLAVNSRSRIDVDGGTSLTLSGVVSGSGEIQKVDNGQLNFTNAGNTFSGPLYIDGGAVQASSVGALGNPSAINLNLNTTLEVSGTGTINSPVTINKPAVGISATITNPASGTAVTLNGPVSLSTKADINLGGAGDIIINSAIGNGNAVISSSTSNALSHYGYHIDNDGLALNINNNGGMMAAGAPADFQTFHGLSLLTDGPGDRGLDFNNDADFQANGSIGQNDHYSNLFVGTLHVGSGQTGDYSFRRVNDDDRMGIWIDIDNDGVFESSQNGLGSDRGEQLQWDNNNSAWTVNLATEGDYLFAVTQREGTGGSGVHVEFTTPSITSWTTIKPTDPAQDGLWSSLEVVYDNNVTKTGSGTLTLAGANSYNGITDIQRGTLVAANSTALGVSDGTAGTGTIFADGTTFALQGNINIGNEHLTIGGSEMTIANLSGNNSLGTQSITVQPSTDAADQVTIRNDAGSLTLGAGGTFDLNYSQLRVDGAGETTISQAITAQAIGTSLSSTAPGIMETIFNDATPGAANNPRGDIEAYRTEALSIGTDDGQGVLTSHLHYNNDASVSTRATELGANGFDNGDFSILWTTEFTPDEDGAWGFRFNHEDDNASIWLDEDQNGSFQSTTERVYDRGCCGGSGDQYTASLTADETYLLGILMNDTGGGGDLRDMEFKAPSGSWTDLDPSASDFFNLTTTYAAPTQYHLIKDGTGLLRLQGNNTYNGETQVNAGTLAIDGTTSGQGSYQIASGSTLGGIGTIGLASGNQVNIQPGAYLSPGAGTGSGIGTLTVDGDVNLDGTLEVEIDATGDPDVFDALVVSGILDITDGSVDFSILGDLEEDAYVFASYGTLVGEMFSDEQGVPEGYSIDYAYDYNGSTNNIALVAPIPEPATIAIWLVGMFGIFVWRRRK